MWVFDTHAHTLHTHTHAHTHTQEYFNDVWVFDTHALFFGGVVSTSRHDPTLLPDGCDLG